MRGRALHLAQGLLLAASGVASAVCAAEPVLGLQSRALVGAPVAGGEGRSARVAVEPALVWKPTPWAGQAELRAKVRLRWLEGAGDERSDVDWRELSARWRGARHTVTVGAQQVNWGRMDLLRLTDSVNPVDQYDRFYEELPEAKRALWMLNWEWQGESQSMQVVATPQVPVDRVPSTVAGLPVQVSRPSHSPGNATLALRYGFETAGWNADLIAVRGWQTTPGLRWVSDASGTGLRGQPVRQDSLGFSADKPLGPTVLRLEGVYARTRADTASSEPARRHASLGAGLDATIGDWFLAVQLIAQHRLDDKRDATGPGNVAFASLIVQRKWLQDRLTTRLTHLRESQAGSTWTSLRGSFELSEHTLLQLQGDVFKGSMQQTFGALRGKSRVAAAIQLSY